MANEFNWRITIGALWEDTFEGQLGAGSCCSWGDYCPYHKKDDLERTISLAGIYKNVDETNLPTYVMWNSTNHEFHKEKVIDVQLKADWKGYNEDPPCSRLLGFKIFIYDSRLPTTEHSDDPDSNPKVIHTIEIDEGGQKGEGGCSFSCPQNSVRNLRLKR